jgi:hypothetical protein
MPTSLHDLIPSENHLLKGAIILFTYFGSAPYQHDWRDFSNWCADRNVSALPAQPELVAIYLAARAASLRTSTLERRLAAIVVEHRRRGEPFDRKHPISPLTNRAGAESMHVGVVQFET